MRLDPASVKSLALPTEYQGLCHTYSILLLNYWLEINLNNWPFPPISSCSINGLCLLLQNCSRACSYFWSFPTFSLTKGNTFIPFYIKSSFSCWLVKTKVGFKWVSDCLEAGELWSSLPITYILHRFYIRYQIHYAWYSFSYIISQNE